VKTLRPRLATAKPRGWQSDSIRGNRHQRGYGYAWEKLRIEILHRDHGLCQPGLKHNEIHVATAVDHKVQKADGGTDDPSNLQAICDACHREKTSSESTRRGGG
jgi:5-methylcytosine-specific restriction protein A